MKSGSGILNTCMHSQWQQNLTRVVTEQNDSFPVWLNLAKDLIHHIRVHKHSDTHILTHTQHSLWAFQCVFILITILINVTYHPFLSRVCSSQSDLGVAVLRTAKLSYYISSARFAAAPQSPDLAPDCTEQHWHHFIPPTSICCDSNQSFASYFSYPCVASALSLTNFPSTDSCMNHFV